MANNHVEKFLFLFLTILISCEKEPGNPVELVNYPPKIITLSASPAALGRHQSSTLSVLADDENGDKLHYQWRTEAGVFLQGTDRKIAIWQAPDVLGSYECMVRVSDDVDAVDSTLIIQVIDVPILRVSEEALDFSHDLSTLSFFIENAGQVDLSWQVIPKKSWIAVNPAEGITKNEPEEIFVTIDRTGFHAGDETGLVRVNSTGGHQDILVMLTTLITPEMIYIPAGQFVMGSDFGAPDELPVHKVDLPDYWIDKYEVTNQQYVEFLNDLYLKNAISIYWGYAVIKDGRKLIYFYDPGLEQRGVDCPIGFENNKFFTERGTENQPVCFLTWYGAMAFAKYHDKRLPTEAEWEKAARGSGGQRYPWGNLEPTKWDANFNMIIGHPTMVGIYSPLGDSPYGCADMCGNAWEWCSSLYDDYPYNPDDGREDLSAEGYRVVRGGGWDSITLSIRSALRTYYTPSDYYPSYGFRCVK